MPRKRTRNHRRLDVYSGAEAWHDYFTSGFAMFDDFAIDTGVEPDRQHRVPREAALNAWRLYGPAFLGTHGVTDTYSGQPVWALREFGEPVHAR